MGNQLWETDKTKKKEYEILGAVNCEKVNTGGKLMEDQSYFSNVCLCRPILVPAFSLEC